MPDPREVHRRATRLMSALMVVIGVAMIATALPHGVLKLGVPLGLLFLLAGAGRLYVTRGGR